MLRAPTLDDADLLFERMASDPEVSHYMSWRPHRDVGETRRVITEIFNVGGEPTWPVELSGGGRPVGLWGWSWAPAPTLQFWRFPGLPLWRRGNWVEQLSLPT